MNLLFVVLFDFMLKDIDVFFFFFFFFFFFLRILCEITSTDQECKAR